MVFISSTSAYSNYLPEGFVYLEEIEPTIIQSIRYYSKENFIGESIDGYKAPKAILTLKAALALKGVQEDVRKDGYSLVVYDAYRPQKASKHFLRWSKDNTDIRNKASFYPYMDKTKCFELGYIGEKSAHSRGSTVDVSIIPLGQKVRQPQMISKRELEDGRIILYLDDNSVDMYTSFDLFDEASHHGSKLIADKCLEKRNYLRLKMRKHNFKDYPTEWWHYTLNDEPYKDQYFEFDVE